MSPNHKSHRIGLVSPCSGNLGNAAILSSMIANIRMRIPNVEIVAFTLSPEDTRRRHGIGGFPITDTARVNYYWASYPSSNETQAQPETCLRHMKEWLKRIKPLRSLVIGIRVGWSELAHVRRVARLVRTLDRVIITGGGALDEFWGGPWGHPWTLFKFGVLSRVCRVPFLFVSVGRCSLEHPVSRFFVRKALRLAQYRSYRDHDSKIAVQAIFRSPDDPVCPDLAYSYQFPSLPRTRRNAFQDERLLVGAARLPTATRAFGLSRMSSAMCDTFTS